MTTVLVDDGVIAKLQRLRENLSRVIQGKAEVIEQMIIALVAGGSVLIEDVPGVGKTTLAKALALSIDADFQRIQFTPDLLPSDIFGCAVYNPRDGDFEFRQGPVFTNVLLADEINRASPRTQSALLQAMAERHVTVDGRHMDLQAPFMVLATQNPLGFHGTFPLPESQLDRFLFQLALEYPDAESELRMLYRHQSGEPVAELKAVLTGDEVIRLQAQAASVNVERSVGNYLVEVVGRTRQDVRLQMGCSPRGSLMLFRAAQAAALVRQRDFVLPDDVQSMAPLVLAHRVVLARGGHESVEYRRELIRDLLRQVDVPV